MTKYYCIFLLIVLTLGTGLLSGGAKSVLRVGIHNFPLNFNPLYITDEVSQAVANKVFDSLFYFDHCGTLTPGLVAHYRIAQNRKSLTLQIKKKVVFPDGKELDSRDVAVTLRIIKDDSYKSLYSCKLHFIRKVEIIDKYTLELFFNQLSS
ncbi:MAG: hypothetical protein GY765_11770 [bacterium]|nr:hypothetical protein [bacterium]